MEIPPKFLDFYFLLKNLKTRAHWACDSTLAQSPEAEQMEAALSSRRVLSPIHSISHTSHCPSTRFVSLIYLLWLSFVERSSTPLILIFNLPFYESSMIF